MIETYLPLFNFVEDILSYAIKIIGHLFITFLEADKYRVNISEGLLPIRVKKERYVIRRMKFSRFQQAHADKDGPWPSRKPIFCCLFSQNHQVRFPTVFF